MSVEIFQKIQELEQITILSKHEQLVNGILNAIDEQILVQGTMLPSVNSMVRELGFARKTIVKAYEELKDRGIVESKKRLGYFIANESTTMEMKVAVLMYAFHPFQEIFYNTFRSSLGDQFQLDVFFHHNNLEVYETILNNIIGRYGMYVVAPIHHESTQLLLSQIQPSKLLIVDRFENIGDRYSYISQEFEMSTYKALQELKKEMNCYKEHVIFFKTDLDYPKGSLRAFERFVKENNLKGKVEENYKEGSVKEGTFYMTFGDVDLWGILKDCNTHGLELGKDVGILSTNDSPVKEFISGGITTFCVDFVEMAEMSSAYIKERAFTQHILVPKLTRRKSL